MLRCALAIAVVALIAGCGVKPAPIYRDDGTSWEGRLPSVGRDHLLNELSMYYGTPYLEGGAGVTGIDCSGLVRVVFSSLGVNLPRTAHEQFARGIPLGRKHVRTGDLIFFGTAGSPTHVGIALTNSDMVHASASRGVVVDSIDDFSRSMRLAGIRRIVRLS
jgi:hypothetical protein